MSKTSPGAVVMALPMEEHEACKYRGISVETYYSLPGIRYWIKQDAPIPLSKSDIIAFYRMSRRKESIENDLSMKQVK